MTSVKMIIIYGWLPGEFMSDLCRPSPHSAPACGVRVGRMRWWHQAAREVHCGTFTTRRARLAVSLLPAVAWVS